MESSLKGSEIPLEYHMLWSKVCPDPDRNDSFSEVSGAVAPLFSVA
jgi:hypothetical protein